MWVVRLITGQILNTSSAQHLTLIIHPPTCQIQYLDKYHLLLENSFRYALAIRRNTTYFYLRINTKSKVFTLRDLEILVFQGGHYIEFSPDNN